MICRATLIGLAALVSVAPARGAEPLPPPSNLASKVKLQLFASGLKEPLALTFARGDARLFVVEKAGRIRVLVGGSVQPGSFVDIAHRLSRGSEQGLLGLAFHPRFSENGRFFVNFTDRKGDTHVAELRVSRSDPTRADPASEHDLLVIKQPFANHNGGNLAFGPDGKLYIGMGDGGSANDPFGNGQNRSSLLAKMLRLDVDRPEAKAEIVQLGLRNPWRYSFDRKSGDLYIADVGQDRYEEVDVSPAGQWGQNFGWNSVEGLGHCLRGSGCDQRGLTQPVLEYTHRVGCSITGGFVYRGRAIKELDGSYFYADYCTGLLRSFRYRDGHVEDSWDWKAALDPESKLATLSSFGEDEAGELYLLSLEGSIYKLVPR